MRLRALVVLALSAGGAAGGPADVVRVERIYYLSDGRAVVVEETSDRPGALESVPVPAPPAARAAVPIPPAARPAPRPVPGVTAPPSFRGAGMQYNPSHTCPSCGYTSPAGQGTWVKRGTGPVPGSHVHQCPQCGTAWYHRDQ